MDEQNSIIEELPAEPRQGSGSILAAERKKKQMTIEEIAQELNLSVTQIKTIELDQTDGLPEPTYVRGYIRSYAKLLGLKPEEVLHNYLNPDWQKTSSLNDIPRGIGAADESAPAFLTPTRLIMLLVTAIVVTLLWYYGMLDSLLGNQSSRTAQSNAVIDANELERSSPNGFESAASAATNSQAEEVDEEQLLAAAEDDAESPSESSTVSETASENLLVMTFSDTSWVDIRDANDERLAYKSYAQGENLVVREAGELQVFIGNAEGVSVELNNEPFDLTQHREGVYAKFVIQAAQ